MKKAFLIVKAMILLIGLILSIPSTNASQVGLAWDASVSPNVGGYVIFYGDSSGAYTSMLDVGNVTEAIVKNLPPEKLQFFALKAYNIGKTIESGFSNEISTITTKDIITPTLPLFTSSASGYTVDLTPVKIIGTTQWTWIAEGSSQGVVTRTLGSRLRLHYDAAGTYPVVLEMTTPTGIQSYQQNVVVGP